MHPRESAASDFAISLPDLPYLALSRSQTHILSTDGEILSLTAEQASRQFHKQSAIVVHGPYTSRRLDLKTWQPFDLLELFAFTYPAKFCVPTPTGLLKAMGVINDMTGLGGDDIVMGLVTAADKMMRDLALQDREKLIPMVEVMGLNGRGWSWAPFVLKSLGQDYDPKKPLAAKSALNTWRKLPEWSEEAPPPPPGNVGVSEDEAHERLQQLLNAKSHAPEARPQQKNYTAQLAHAFEPMSEEEQAKLVLAEAGTGVGKTLGYLAPASVWAEKNEGSVWLSTYTKSLQRQIESELDCLYPERDLKRAHVTVRKGRENYLCLLNLEEKATSAALSRDPVQPVALGIMARWAGATEDGDLTGKDFPSWLSSLLGFGHTNGLADRRGECIYSACDHYHRCFVEKSVRKSKRSRLVIANHAVVMIQAALSGPQDNLPSRYVFDEGHHLFDAADSAFAAHLTGRETYDLRRWLIGATTSPGGSKSRARGLKKRVEDLIAGDQDAEDKLNEIISSARVLPDENWPKRLKNNEKGSVSEQFLQLVYKQVWVPGQGKNTPYSIETATFPVLDEMLDPARKFKSALKRLYDPIMHLSKLLEKRLEDDMGEMAGDTRKRIDAVVKMLNRKAETAIKPWINMLETLEVGKSPEEFVDWMEIERIEGRVIDVGMYRHYVDPMKPFAASMKPHTAGMAITSATLTDKSGEGDNGWAMARRRTGSPYISPDIVEFSHESPFDYADMTKVIIINDVNKNDMRQVAGAYQTLFTASHGGAMGIFTAIQRLQAIYGPLRKNLEAAHIPLYAQHIDPLDPGTLVDIFREDTRSCLLGTDAMRDGVDVPGESLRLIVFDRVPWPRPTLLHKARRSEFGGREYDDMLTRLKIKQAFGRLVRRHNDRGVFVMLDSMLPSRLHSAFPADVEIVKTGLGDAKD